MTEGTERDCTNCGKPIRDEPFAFWLFRRCQSCAAEPAPERFRKSMGFLEVGTYRKWRYYPQWHYDAHPEHDLPFGEDAGEVA